MAPVQFPYFTLLVSQLALKCAPLLFQLAEFYKELGPVDGLSISSGIGIIPQFETRS